MKYSEGIILCCLIILVGGCNNLKTLEPSVKYTTAFPGKTIAVRSFEEMREKYFYDKTILAAIPLFPFGFSETEQFYELHSVFSKDLARGLEYSNLFQKVYYDPGFTVDSDYIIEGEIISTKKRHYRMSYCISGVAVLLWVARLPQDIYVNEIVVNCRLTDGRTGEIMFENIYTATAKYYEFFFTGVNVKYKDINIYLSRIISNSVIKDVKRRVDVGNR